MSPRTEVCNNKLCIMEDGGWPVKGSATIVCGSLGQPLQAVQDKFGKAWFVPSLGDICVNVTGKTCTIFEVSEIEEEEISFKILKEFVFDPKRQQVFGVLSLAVLKARRKAKAEYRTIYAQLS